MRVPLTFAAAALLIGATMPVHAETNAAPQTETQAYQSEAFSAAKRKKKSTAGRSGYQAYGRSGTQIACTQFGCHPIPPGCRIRTGYNPWTWDPTGFDEVVCPYRR
jgi:hypothetical protein